MRFRGKSIRRKIVALMLVPLVALTSIWAFATVITGREADRMLDAAAVMGELGEPVQEAVLAVQAERRSTLVHLADPRRSDSLTALRDGQRATDEAVAALRARAGGEEIRGELDGDPRRRLDDLLTAFDRLGRLRARVADNTIERQDAYDAYNALVDPCHTFLTGVRGVDDIRLEREGRALIGLSRAREYLSRQDALLAAAFTAGRMTGDQLRAVSDRVAERELAYRTHLSMLSAEDREGYQRFWSGTDGRTLRAAEDSIIGAGAGGALKAFDAERWQKTSGAVLEELRRMDRETGERYHRRVEPEVDSVLLRAAVVGILGFAAVVVSVAVSLRIGRGLVRDLGALRREAGEAAGVRLPEVMRRLAAGEQVDVETEAPRLEYGRDEIGQVGQALNTLQRSAVEAAVRQADVRRGVSEVFVNLARRSQVLLHRQLTLLDAMERRTEDPGELADLFRLDHLTTRMRRHAEGLVILSGATPSRQWRKPIPLMDVVRAAVSEVEDYERIEVRGLPPLAVDGAAIADLTHLVAELLENATVFSPPHTAVQVLGERVPSGFALEIHDRGLGMSPDALLEANLRLSEAPDFRLSDTDRLGLFVVSRLGRRQNVRVCLQPSPYGGTTAVVLIPGALLTEIPAAPRDAVAAGEEAGDAGHRTDGVRTAAGLPLRGARPVIAAARSGPAEPGSREGGSEETGGGVGALLREPPAGHRGEPPPRPPLRRPPGEGGGTGFVRELRPGAHRSPEENRDQDHGRDRGRDADRARARMASLQHGLRRGRQQSVNSPGDTGVGDSGDGNGSDGGTGSGDRTPRPTHWRGTADDHSALHRGGRHPSDG
ncbi:nitrate- and nitrite sensing domain-containing protein [Streptomyces sp. CNQ085]|uniref:sensor histidine kinase n=1 Tax=Streptomyces sp. CNQ085 TaxID=2886944 RepID=UPI001F511593|nr:nitrate- and nitrite sensing domain-containing protein [Streptomyces sp. CNQ085]MCI0385705.1 nitrate- and nitrite sensing domain-containing protein [Streptomyces sp. CNQ085]